MAIGQRLHSDIQFTSSRLCFWSVSRIYRTFAHFPPTPFALCTTALNKLTAIDMMFQLSRDSYPIIHFGFKLAYALEGGIQVKWTETRRPPGKVLIYFFHPKKEKKRTV